VAAAPEVRLVPTRHGDFAIVVADGCLVATGWLALGFRPPDGARENPRLRPDLAERIRAALAGEPVDFRDEAIPNDAPFTLACRRAAQAIPAGATATYAELAVRAGGSRGAARAAGGAMRRNPVPIVVPCHRVVAAGGLGGFAGGTRRDCPAVRVKAELIAAEARRNPRCG